MSVVSADWCDPSTWLKCRVAYAVVRDGEQVRFCRCPRKGKAVFSTFSADTWKLENDFRKTFEQDRKRGAVLVSGLPPHRVMLRNLESPLKDADKSREIWGTLLDAAIPFSLEKCQVAFLPRPPKADGGLRCLAAAARVEDLQEVLAEWDALDLQPDLLFPEELMLPHKPFARWLGSVRTVFAAWNEEGFAGGGAVKPEQRQRQLVRFEQSRSEEGAPVEWWSCGPDAKEQPEFLEHALAKAALTKDALHANLRTGSLNSPDLDSRYARKGKTLKVAAILVMLLLFLFPLLLRHQLRGYQQFLRGEISQSYQRLTGSRSPAPGQEALLARRYQEERWGALWQAVEPLRLPTVSMDFTEAVSAGKRAGLLFSRIEIQEGSFTLYVKGKEENVQKLIRHLSDNGWRVNFTSGPDDTWILQGGSEA